MFNRRRKEKWGGDDMLCHPCHDEPQETKMKMKLAEATSTYAGDMQVLEGIVIICQFFDGHIMKNTRVLQTHFQFSMCKQPSSY